MHTPPSRRTFVASAATLGLSMPAILPRLTRAASPNSKLNIAGIGVGGMGFNNIRQMAGENIVALCDVDRRRYRRPAELFPEARLYQDYRRLLDDSKDIEAVLVATPDHTHAVITSAVMAAGKHVYCQKPLTHDVWEARMLAQQAKSAGVVTQMGNQYHSSEGIRLACEWIADGAIGPVRRVDAWCSLAYSPFGHAYWSTLLGDRPTETPPVPEELDWNTWLGPAPFRSYHPTYHPAKWRAWWDFGCGMMGDRGVHTLDSVFWSLKLGAPSKIELVHRERGNDEVHPDIAHVKFHFEPRGDMPAVVVNWYEGIEAPRPSADVLEPDRQMGDKQGGAIYYGDSGALMHGTYPGSVRLIPEPAMQAYKRPARTLPRATTVHEKQWIESCKANQPASSDFSYAGPLTEMCLLGNIAIRLGGVIEWDSENMKAIGRPEADPWIKRPRREGWALHV
ncbi:Gfo/Idh/MocA family oxidoreductase [Planctomycetales bacterium ZRK34]|nr:Gfo/Idh/MocA family oxidoreductase [Planctomycetales bacterium ZRK34]